MTEKFIMTTQSADRIGIVAALTACLAAHEGFITELAQFGTPSSERFYSRIEFTIDAAALPKFHDALGEVCAQLELNTTVIAAQKKTKTLIMVSKFDHCLADLIYRHRKGDLLMDICAVVSNHESVRAQCDAAGLRFHYLPITAATKAASEQRLSEIMRQSGAELIVLARYMQILSEEFCAAHSGKIINIHHSFLPSFKGAKPYHRAYARGVKLIGATAHYVTQDLDEGPIIEQSVERVDHTMTPERLIMLGRDVEARTLARAVELHCEHRVFINGPKTVVLP